MDIPENWLRSYVDPPLDGAALAEELTMAGLEVEERRPVAPHFNGVVVGLVKSVERHPNADKLTVCEVDAGTVPTLRIVCGAPNVAAGIRVPCALPGAVLPGEIKIKPTVMRGVESQGMLCSARELGLSDDHAGLLVLQPDAPVGRDVREVLELDDHVLTIKLTPNRADCLSVLGVAREVAAVSGAELRLPAFTSVAPSIEDRLPVKVEASDLCGRFSGRVIRGVNARAVTPQWMQQRLLRCGQRPISVLVDISNYVMLELGRPSHVFDLDKVSGGLTVRWGRDGESLELLNGQTVAVDETVGVIADRLGVEALAGIMGGQATAVSLDTRNIYIEAAFWWPDAIRGRARRFNFSTDAAHRFERGVDFATTREHVDYISRLIIDHCGGEAGPIDDTVVQLPPRDPVTMRFDRCRRVLGLPLTADQMAEAFERLRLDWTRTEDAFVVTPPSYRFDLETEEDLIEEVARLHGYDSIPDAAPLAPARMRSRPEGRRSAHQVRNAMVALGYQELINYSFVDRQWEVDFAANAEPIAVLNPISAQMSVMRSSLVAGLVDRLVYNLNRKAARVRLFEIGRIFRRDPSVSDGPLSVQGIAQPTCVAALAYGPADDEQWGVAARPVDFYDVRGDVERLFAPNKVSFEATSHPALHPGRGARVVFEGREVGIVGELHPRLQQQYELPKAAVVFQLEVDPLLVRKLPSVGEIPKFQPLQRDLAVIVDEGVNYGAIESAINALSLVDDRLSGLEQVLLFDVYRPLQGVAQLGEAGANALLNKDKSLAIRLVLQDTERPLSDTDADAAVTAVVEELARRFGARLRQ
jgi:phenylalanyl-tRNA synthetase beta chain